MPELKATGIVRKLDHLGRVVIPMELRRTFDLKEGDGMEIYVDAGKIVLGKYSPACIFCGGRENIGHFKDKLICKCCANEIMLWPAGKEAV